ncbi:unnamed protein product, partial [marine sediment metagenome]
MKIGLFVCDCGRNISGTIDNEYVINYFSQKPEVHVLRDQYLCSESGVNKVIDELTTEKIDRVVIAA